MGQSLLSRSHLIIVVFVGLSRKLVRSIPVVICEVPRAIDTSMEPAELPGTVRKCAEREVSCQIECAATDRAVAAPGVKNDIAVQYTRGSNKGLEIKDF